MARKRKQSRDEDEESVGVGSERVHPSRSAELAGLIMLLASLALSVALYSFDPEDAKGAHNLVGPLGTTVAALLLGGIGYAGYVAAALSVVVSTMVLLGRMVRPSFWAVTSFLMVTLGATILAELLAGGADLTHTPGGLIGSRATALLRGVAGPAGAGLLATGLVISGAIGLLDVSFSRALNETVDALMWCVRRVSQWLAVRTEARRVGLTRETELVEAARSARARVYLEREERERIEADRLEEKKRVAVLRATARGEERARKKITEEDAQLNGLEPTELEVGDGPEVVISGKVLASVEDGEDDVWEDEDAEEEDEEAEEEDLEGEEEEDEEYEEEDDDEEGDEEEEEEELVDHETLELDDGQIESTQDIQGSQQDGPRIHARLAVEASFDEEEDRVVEAKEMPIAWRLPPIQHLDYEGDPPAPVDGAVLRARATRLEEKLKTYGVEGKVTAIRPGPVVTTYEYQPAPGVKVSKIANLSDDIAMSMEALRVRIVAPIPGRGVVGIELPNARRENVYLKELIADERFRKSKSLLTLALGKNAEGEPQVRDLRKMPHLLIAGTTGSGKSVSINTIILSILYKATPDQVKFIMVDPKMLELSLYEDIPHLLLPVVTDPKKASLALHWAVNEMERRYQLLSDMKVRDIDGFNRKLERMRDARDAVRPVSTEDDVSAEESDAVEEVIEDLRPLRDLFPGKELPKPLPYIVVLIDEFADLMCVASRDVEASVQRLAQKARAAGIHVLLATQRPSTDVITGVIKNNFPSRIAFRVASRHDSGTILNSPGAENLLGMGDSLMLGVDAPAAVRIHGGYVSEDEVERVVEFWKCQAKPKYDQEILKPRDDEDGEGIRPEDVDDMYDMAVRIVADTRRASISLVQRRLRIGYNRAARIVEMMEQQGVVGPPTGPKAEREVLVPAPED
jgi:DNA segregation ATPase FtsK/SpoIIIE, S-DNA-T family